MYIDHYGSRLRCFLLIFSLYLTPHRFLIPFSGSFFPPLSYLLPIRSRSSLKPSQFSPVPHLLSRCKAPPTWMLPAPATRHPSPLFRVPCVAWLHLLPFLCQFDPPFVAVGLHSGPCRPLGGLPIAGPSASPCTCLVLPKLSSKSCHHPVLVSVSGGFLRKGERPRHLHSLAVARPGPRLPLI